MSLRSEIGKFRRRLLSSFYQRTTPIRDLGPIVTITFDDFPRSALTIGGNILERFHARATYYVAMGVMSTTNHLGPQFVPSDLHALMERGHELALHGFDHLSARKNSVNRLLDDLDECANAIRQHVPEGSTRNFAYPYGEATLTAKKKLGPHLMSSRGTCAGINGPDIDLNLLRANYLYGDVDQAEAAHRLIIENQRKRGWLIFYTHDVAENPSPYGCTPRLLEDVVNFATQQSVTITTVADVMSRLDPKI